MEKRAEESPGGTADLPDSINWNLKGGVTPVKNQGFCGSCWTFSTTGALEGHVFASRHELISMSEQFLLDCDEEGHGCFGGLMTQAFEYVRKKGLCSEASYPYKCEDEYDEECQNSRCNYNCTFALKPHTLTSVVVVRQTVHALMMALLLGPVSVAIEADSGVFQSYKSGVITSPLCGSKLNHGVLCVGYGEEHGTKYFLVKNSWGTDWGLKGYVKIGRDPAEELLGGACGILKMASYPKLVYDAERTLEVIV